MLSSGGHSSMDKSYLFNPFKINAFKIHSLKIFNLAQQNLTKIDGADRQNDNGRNKNDKEK